MDKGQMTVIAKSRAKGRTYTDADREAFLVQWELNGRNTKKTCREKGAVLRGGFALLEGGGSRGA